MVTAGVTRPYVAAFFISLIQLRTCISFTLVQKPTIIASDHHLSALKSHAGDRNLSPIVVSSTRRDALALVSRGIGSGIIPLLTTTPQNVNAAMTVPDTNANPIIIIGANGRTGMAVAENLAARGATSPVVTTTRSGTDPFRIIKLPADTKQYLSHCPRPVDVRDAAAVRSAVEGVRPPVRGIVYAASASKGGGDASDVDRDGVRNVATVAEELGARFVLISALAVDRPDSKSFKVTNGMGGYVDKIMDRKREGEDAVRDVMRSSKNYVIVRPGVLLSGKTRDGPGGIELNQGDTVGGGLSRDELAGVCAGAMLSGVKGVTVEVYRKSTRTGLQPEFTVPSGNELTADSYVGLFEKAKSDVM